MKTKATTNKLKRVSIKRLSFDAALDRTFRKTALTAAEFGFQFAQHGHSWAETKRELVKIYSK